MVLLGLALAKTVFLLTSFRGDGDGLHIAYSLDGKAWEDTAGIYLKPSVGSGLMRDPHLLHGPDGTFHLVWTTGWKDKGIGYASSRDLIRWSPQRYLPLMENVAGTETCWAPETFYDAPQKRFVITWSSSVEGRFPETVSKDRMNHRTYAATTKDFKAFSSPEVVLDPGFDHIDTTLIREGAGVRAVFKEGDKQAKKEYGPIWTATAPSPLGPYTVDPRPLVTERAEGPTLARIEGRLTMLVDFYADGKYAAYAQGNDGGWAATPVETVPGQRHGTILEVPKPILEALLKRQKATLAKLPKPILDGFTADPAIRVFGDRYYIYPTSDKPNWQTTDFSVWSSKDLVDWKREAMVLDVTKDLKWANIEAWAPDSAERDGKYYFYFCAKGQIGVAVGDRPTGPFKDALDRPLIAKDSVKTYPIDPCFFRDDDGQDYLYFGNGTPTVYKLNRDMVSFDGPPVQFPLKDFREGIVVFKRKGLYYFMWSMDDARSDDYRVGYGTSKSPLGPVESPKEFVVMRKNGMVKGTGHHSVVNVPNTDRWYAIYHRHAIPGGGGFKRETCLAEIKFGEDGSILPIDVTTPFRRREPIRLR
ncbi:glycosyl hydrolase family 43 [bacterium]|nr:MAG: glycosyl hydrolase family 43 [bacterium]